ncbi:cation:proton antiporter [Fulvivirga maritima]|uniref:cation:proton antiporter domain-containing protein n=1 Tax=Fulvivirga maritima TaxID=2904247 RepID=UPI001F3FB3CF|nr:cation:proton antiporter [Fulvivirga maritima]UII28142.1 cation:proton antiporter [Fulvivirga maritima]
MEIFNSYTAIITISIIVIMSYFFNIISKKTNIPSVLLLILSGVLIKLGLNYFDIPTGQVMFHILEILGIVGLIMIVLEASLDLELTWEKWPLIWKSFAVAFIALLVCSFIISYLLQILVGVSFITGLLYAIPLAIMSSAIVIPSVGELTDDKKEFMVYESTFSDILGIMYFYFLTGNLNNDNVNSVVWDVFSNIFITIVLSIIISYALVLIFQKVQTQVKLFLLIAVLLLLYSIGKQFHLSSLLIILIFGLVLNNHKVFFRGKLRKLLHTPSLGSILRNFHLVTLESAFVVRTFFFVIFGITIDLNSLLNLNVLLISAGIIVVILGVRGLALWLFKGKNLMPEILIAPRGLITILLFFDIPTEFQSDNFNSGILLYTILITSVVMAISLISTGKHIEPVEAVKMAYWKEVDKQIDSIPEQDKNKSVEKKKEEAENDNSEPEQKLNE